MLQDVYGINSDFSVWYIDNDGKIYGVGIKPVDINPDEKLIFNDDELAKSFEKLVKKSKDDITLKDVIGITTLHLNRDGDTPGIKRLDALKYLPSLKSLYLYDLKLDNLDGLKYLDKLKKIVFDDSTSNDFTTLGSVYRLNSLLFWCGDNDSTGTFYYISDNELDKVFDSIKNLTRLTGISIGSYYDNKNIKNATQLSNNLQKLNNKSTIKKLFIWNNELTGPIDLKGYSGLSKINIYSSNYADKSGITEFKNINNCTNLYYLDLHNNNLTNINGISNLRNLRYVNIAGNNNFDASSISNIADALSTCNGNIQLPISCVNNSTQISQISEYNSNLSDNELDNLKNNKNIKVLNLGENENLSFDKIKEVLPTLTNLEYLDLTKDSSITDLNWLYREENGNKVSNFPNLKILIVNFSPNITDFSPINTTTSLNELYLRATQVKNIDFLLNDEKTECALKNLKILDLLYDGQLTDVSAFSKENNIIDFRPYGSSISDISYLKNSKLQSLFIGNTHSLYFDKNNSDTIKRNIAINNIDAINSITNLNNLCLGTYQGSETSKLDMRDIQIAINKCVNGFNILSYTEKTQQVIWLDQISNCSNITFLYLLEDYFNNSIPEKISVTNCTNLRTLVIPHCHARSLEIGNANKLEKMYCSSILAGQYVQFPDISKATNLKQIEWYNNQLNDSDIQRMADGLANNSNIENIYLANNAIYDISPLASLKGKLKKLTLEYNNIAQIDSNMNTFLTLKQNGLNTLMLKGNQITDYSLLLNESWDSNDFNYKESEDNYDIE